MLGHNLRTPLVAVTLGADLLRQKEELGARGQRIIAQITTSAQRANQMVNDLLDLARCNLGTGIPVRTEKTDLTSVCHSVVNELTTAHPKAQIIFTDSGTVTGQYDPSRLAQAFSNLIGNAVRHGKAQSPIKVTLSGDGATACFCVQITESLSLPTHSPLSLIRTGVSPSTPRENKEHRLASGWDYS